MKGGFWAAWRPCGRKSERAMNWASFSSFSFSASAQRLMRAGSGDSIFCSGEASMDSRTISVCRVPAPSAKAEEAKARRAAAVEKTRPAEEDGWSADFITRPPILFFARTIIEGDVESAKNY